MLYVRVMLIHIVPNSREYPIPGAIYIYTAKTIKQFFEGENFKVMAWPAQSPGLSPDLWNIIGAKETDYIIV